MKLFDGAHVLLRNGEECKIQKNSNEFSRFPWVSDDRGGQRRTWTAEGRYTEARGIAHALDIVSIRGVEKASEPSAKGDPDLFNISPYVWDGGAWPAGVKFRCRNGSEFDGLTFLGDEIFTSPRNYVWDKHTGRNIVFTATAVDQDDKDWDIRSILVPKTPAELVGKDPAMDDFINTDLGKPYDPDANVTMPAGADADLSFDYPYTSNRRDRRHLMMFESTPGAEPDYTWPADEIPSKIEKKENPGAEPDYTWPAKLVVLSAALHARRCWDAAEDPAKLAEKAKFTLPTAPLYADYVPGKHLMRMMKNMAKALGGTLERYQWESTSKITFDVIFRNKLRKKNTDPIAYMKSVTIEVSGCDNNAVLPMKKVKP